MDSKRTKDSPRAGELVRKTSGEKRPARRSTSELQKAREPGATAVRAVQGQGFFSFRYSYKEVSRAGGKTRVRAQEHRFEDGKFSSEEFEGVVDGAVYEDAEKQAREFVAGQIGSVFRLFSAFLPFSSRPKSK